MFIQQWPSPTFSNNSPHNINGVLTSAGPLLIAIVGIRDTNPGPIYISDTGGNLWREAVRETGGSVTAAILYSERSAPMDRITITVPGGSGVRSLLMVEAWAGAVHDTAGWDGTNATEALTAPLDVEAGGFLVAGGIASVSDRTWVPQGGGVAMGAVARGGQTSIFGQHYQPTAAGSFSPGWLRQSGSPAALTVIAASFKPSPFPNPHAMGQAYMLTKDGAWMPQAVTRL